MGAVAESINDAEQYLSFFLNDEEYCLNILKVQEIRGWEKVKPIPNAPSYVVGVFNLRGSVIPIVDLRLRFGMEKKEYKPTTVVIVIKLHEGNDRSQVVGVVVDAVADVYDIDKSDIKPTPDMVCDMDTKYLQGVATLSNKMVSIVNMDFVFDSEELAQI